MKLSLWFPLPLILVAGFLSSQAQAQTALLGAADEFMGVEEEDIGTNVTEAVMDELMGIKEDEGTTNMTQADDEEEEAGIPDEGVVEEEDHEEGMVEEGVDDAEEAEATEGVEKEDGTVAVDRQPEEQEDRVASGIIINEISDRGTSDDVCQGKDWVELYNPSPTNDVVLDGYRLHDDRGMMHPNAFDFPPGTIVASQEYLLLCSKLKIPTDEEESNIDAAVTKSGNEKQPHPMSPQFGIGADDTITLIKVTTSVGSAQTVEIIDSVGPLPNTLDRFGVSYALDSTTGQFNYTSTPTPGSENILSPVMSIAELNAAYKKELVARNDMGTEFFGMDSRGYQVKTEKFPTVLDLHVQMDPDQYTYMMGNASWETYRDFDTATLQNPDTDEVVWTRSVPGRIRTKGQSTLYFGACVGSRTIPFQLDMSSDNLEETMFGVGTVIMKNHLGDYSSMRDWSYHRMLARFGLPHMRARKVRFYINGERMGFYTLLEAPDQDYVFNRGFPNFDPNSYALYKIKSLAIGCGSASEEEKMKAVTRLDELKVEKEKRGTKDFPYNFNRGDWQKPIEEIDNALMAPEECLEGFFQKVLDDFIDTVVAWEEHGQDCGEMMVEEGLVDRDLGKNDYDKEMKDYLNAYMHDGRPCDPFCENQDDIGKTMDVEQVLKTMAFYATTLVTDSPMISKNNFYLAQTGDGLGWKIVAHDFNQAASISCLDQDDACNTRLPHLSIIRPTCTALEEQPIVGPLLLDPTFHQKYLEYAREFVDTVMTNTSLLEEMEEHVNDISKYAISDIFLFFGAYFNEELSPDAADWRETEARFPLLPTLKARTEDLKKQFAALDAGTFPRGPHNIGVEGDNEPWEPCADWRAPQANRSKCEQECRYAGCHMEEFTVPSYCDEVTGKCYHGDFDKRCEGIYDMVQYPGMEEGTFCREAAGNPVKTKECPAPGAAVLQSTPESASLSRVMSITTPLMGMLLFLLAR